MYRKATGNLAGTLDLMLTYVENGTEFTRQFGKHVSRRNWLRSNTPSAFNEQAI